MKPASLLPTLLLGAGLAQAAAHAASAAPTGDPGAPLRVNAGLVVPARSDNAGAPVPFEVAQASDAAFRLQQLEQEVRQLTGKVEDLNFQLLQMQERMRKMQEDNEFRFQQLEGNGGQFTGSKTAPAKRGNSGGQDQSGLAGQQPSQRVGAAQRTGGDQIASVLEQTNPPRPTKNVKTIDGVEVYQGPSQTEGGLQPQTLGKLTFDANGNIVGSNVEKPIDLTGGTASTSPAGQQPGGNNESVASLELPDNPGELYDLGYSYIQAGQYARAEDAFEEFSQRYPDNPKISEARFWVGESLLSRGMYEDAAKVFLDAHKRYPKSRMGPQTMLKLGVSLAGMKQRELACATFAKIPGEYPRVSGAVRAKIAAEQKAASCKAG